MKKLLILCFLFGGVGFGWTQTLEEGSELVNLGRKLNSPFHEGAPVISADGNTMYFFVNNHPKNTNGTKGSQDIWYSTRDSNGEWSQAEHMGAPFNIHISNQVFAVLDNGNTLFIRGGKAKNSKGFSFVRRQGSGWGGVQELNVQDFKKMNQGRFYGASMSSDAKVMIIYMSERPNQPFSELYVSFNEGGTKWSTPKMLPKNLNTNRDEFGPFLAYDDKTLYFSSNRKDMGLGQADIYKTTRLDDTWLKWSDPENLGEPINTSGFDAYFTMDAAGNIYITRTNASPDGSNLDIYGVKPKEPEHWLRGLVLNTETKQAVPGAMMKIGPKTRAAERLTSGDADGDYLYNIKVPGQYQVDINAHGYEPFSEMFSLEVGRGDTTIFKDFLLKAVPPKTVIAIKTYDNKTKELIDAHVEVAVAGKRGHLIRETADAGYLEFHPEPKLKYMLVASLEGYLSATDSVEMVKYKEGEYISKSIYLDPIEIGTTVILKNIFFDFDKTTLKEESFIELDKVLDFMRQNPTLELEISGHTDGKGSDSYNLNLSQGRAESVVNYLVNNGIQSYRLTPQGYGKSKPIATNETDEGRAINRRVEFTVLKK
jgi:OmpA-OmpF porin, OOP family